MKFERYSGLLSNTHKQVSGDPVKEYSQQRQALPVLPEARLQGPEELEMAVQVPALQAEVVEQEFGLER